MKKNYFTLTIAVLIFAVAAISCSNEDDAEVEPTTFDTSLLPGYWVVVSDGVDQNNGVWFSTEPLSDNPSCKLVKYWWRKNPSGPLHRIETTFWQVESDGGISIWMWEGGRTVTYLSHTRLVISNWWLGSDVGIVEYRRLSSTPKIIE